MLVRARVTLTGGWQAQQSPLLSSSTGLNETSGRAERKVAEEDPEGAMIKGGLVANVWTARCAESLGGMCWNWRLLSMLHQQGVPPHIAKLIDPRAWSS